MKKLISVIFCLIFFNIVSFAQIKEIKTDIYTSIFNEE